MKEAKEMPGESLWALISCDLWGFMVDLWWIYGGFMVDLWWIYGGFVVIGQGLVNVPFWGFGNHFQVLLEMNYPQYLGGFMVDLWWIHGGFLVHDL